MPGSITSPEGSCVDLCFPLYVNQVCLIRRVLDVVSRLDEREVDQRSIVVNVANRSIVFAIDDFNHLAGEPRCSLLRCHGWRSRGHRLLSRNIRGITV